MNDARWSVKSVLQSSTDDCVRAAVCSILDLDPADYSDYVSDSGWFTYWSEKLDELGFALIEASASYQAMRNAGLWIGLPPSLHDPGGHAVVMCGRELVHDPGRRRPSYDQERVDAWLAESSSSALLIVPHDPGRCHGQG